MKKESFIMKTIFLFLLFLLLIPALASAASPVASFTPNRTSGVAPLSVFFDGTGTTDADTTTPFHDLICYTNFGDSQAGTWTNGSGYNTSKNLGIGLLAAHIYENVGSYTATSRCFDGTTWSNIVTNSITVTNPETVFATTTACVANGTMPSAGLSGCPATATLFYNSSDFDATLNTAKGAGARRILWRRGDTFISSADGVIDVAGPGIISSYGSGALPVFSTTLLKKIISFLSTASDWRIFDVAFDGGSAGTNEVSIGESSTPSDNITVLRTTNNNTDTAVSTYPPHLFVQDISQNASGTAGPYGVFYNKQGPFSIQGIYCNPMGSGGHCIRLNPIGTEGSKFIIEHNTLYVAGSTALALRGNERYTLVSDNKIIGSDSTSILWVGPQNLTAKEYQYDLLLERNWIVYGSGSSGIGCGSFSTFRNNIVDMTATTLSNQKGIAIAYGNTVGAHVYQGCNVYNNTFYSGTTTKGMSAVSLTTASAVTVTPSGANSGTIITVGSATGSNSPGEGATMTGGGLTGTATILSCSSDCKTAASTITLAVSNSWDGSAITVDDTPRDNNVKNNIVYAPDALKDGSGAGAHATVIIDGGVNTTGAAGTYGNTTAVNVYATKPGPFTAYPPVNPTDFRIPSTSYAADMTGQTGVALLFPSNKSDFFNCQDKSGTKITAGAMVPAANALCKGVK